MIVNANLHAYLAARGALKRAEKNVFFYKTYPCTILNKEKAKALNAHFIDMEAVEGYFGESEVYVSDPVLWENFEEFRKRMKEIEEN